MRSTTWSRPRQANRCWKAARRLRWIARRYWDRQRKYPRTVAAARLEWTLFAIETVVGDGRGLGVAVARGVYLPRRHQREVGLDRFVESSSRFKLLRA